MNGIVRIATGLSAAWMTVLLVAPVVTAYDLLTHETLSRVAFDQGRIAITLESLYGIRSTDTFRGPLSLLGSQDPQTAENWIVQGARDEDFTPRPLNHFWNPLTDAPLTVAGIPLGNRAPDWALEDRTGFTSQSYSYRDARDAFATALTASDPTARERAWGHTFYALGHVIHTIQDMAQPQHTRNDQHFHLGSSRSLMERYVEEGIQQGRFLLTGATTPQVTRARDLWARQLEDGRPQGLARFSNGNFVSAGTNFTEWRTGAIASGFPSPALNLANVRSSTSADRCKDGTTPPGGDRLPLIFYGNTMTDPVTGSTLANPRMTTYSIFDQYLQARGFELIFALNCFNLDTAADLLLPRAVAYSAELLRYFFRGELEAALELDYSSNPPIHVLRVTNRTRDEAMRGTIALHYESSDGTRKRLRSWEALTLEPNQTSNPLPLPQPPRDHAQPGRYLLVFHGQLGEETDAVAARWIGAGLFLVELWYDTYYPTEGGLVDFVPAPISPPWDAFPVNAYVSHTRWLFYEGGGGESRAAEVTHVLRPLELLPGNTATLRFYGRCYGGTIEPVVAELVALAPPPDLATLETLTWSTQPAVVRVIHRVSNLASDWSGAGTATVDLNNATFLGLRLLSVPVATPPAPPSPFPPFTTSYADCRMQMLIQPQSAP